MKQSQKNWAILGAVFAVIAGLAYANFHQGQRGLVNANGVSSTATPSGTRKVLTVAFVPVTCHLTCPVTDFASKTSTTGTEFDAQLSTGFPAMVEAMKANRLDAAFLTVPLAMQLREQGVPVKICCLGHRNGSALMVRADSTAKTVADLKGKTIAIPSPFSDENLLLRDLMQRQGLHPGDINIVTMKPPDMPVALAGKQIDGFIVAEPFCSAVELNHTGRELYSAKDVWPNYISCALVVSESLIKKDPAVVRDLVRGIVGSGEWAEHNREDAAKLVAPYFRQKPSLLNYVLTHPRDRVSYTDLTPGDAEMQHIEDLGIQLGILHKHTPMSELMDKSFIPATVAPAKIDVSKIGTMPKA